MQRRQRGMASYLDVRPENRQNKSSTGANDEGDRDVSIKMITATKIESFPVERKLEGEPLRQDSKQKLHSKKRLNVVERLFKPSSDHVGKGITGNLI